jgi:hypothetical protein
VGAIIWRDFKERFMRPAHQWLMPVILATWEAGIKTISFQGQYEQIVYETPFPK